MKKTIQTLVFSLLCVFLLSGSGQAADFSAADILHQAAQAQRVLMGGQSNQTILGEETLIPAGQSASDWTAISFALAGEKEDSAAYLDRLETYVTTCYQQSGGLDRSRATEWHRILLTVLALGGDPTAFGTDSTGAAINLVADGTYDYINDDITKQGLNGAVYALLALDANSYSIPDSAAYTREDLLNLILDAQNEDGSFGLVRGAGDIDITAMVLQALAPYAQQQADTVQQALAYLAAQQNPDGSFSGYGTANCESTAQVILALCALNMPPDDTEQFCKAGGSPVDALLTFRLADGSFAHSWSDSQGDVIATWHAMLAVCACERQTAGNGRIFDFTNKHMQPCGLCLGIGAAVFLCIGILIIVLLRRRKKL